MSARSGENGSIGSEIAGIFPIVYTPFDAEGAIDFEGVRRLVDHMIAAGVHGLAPSGGASESAKMALDERMRLTEVIVEQSAGRVPFIAGVTAPAAAEQLRLARHAAGLGASAVFALPPKDAGEGGGKPSEEFLRRHYLELGRSSPVPVMVQEVSQPVPPELIARLNEECPNIRYIKEEAPDSGHRITAILALTGDGVRIFSGGANLLDDLARGAVGAIPGSIGMADLSRAYDRHVAGDRAGARRAFYHFLPLAHWRRPFGLLGAKEVLRRQGVFKAAYLRPPAEQRLDEHDLRELDEIMGLMGPPY